MVEKTPGSWPEVLRAFLKLGLTRAQLYFRLEKYGLAELES